MGDMIPFRRPIRWADLRADEAERVVRERAANTDNIIISQHALKRSRQRFGGRDFIAEDLFDILTAGMIRDRPEREDDKFWKVIVTKRMPGTRDAGAVTLIATNDDTLFVKTVEWMDLHR
jgi:hypothetical protein